MKRTTKGKWAMAAAIGVILGLGVSARATVIYSGTFDTDTTDMLTDYAFTSSQPGYNYRVEGGQALWTSPGGGYYMNTLHTISYTYDWSQPLQISANLGTTATSGGSSYGLVLGSNGTGVGLNVRFDQFAAGKGVMYMNQAVDQGTRVYVETTPYPPIGSSGNDVVALTIRQNGDDLSKFDIMMEINGTAYTANTGGWWALPVGIVAADGWLTGVSKAGYFGSSGAITLANIGFRADGLSAGTQTLDNLTLQTIPEPATFSMLGAAAMAMLLRRRFAK